jgi:hypothetical protein
MDGPDAGGSSSDLQRSPSSRAPVVQVEASMAQEGFFVADPRSWAAAPSVPRRDPSDAAAPCDPRDRVERLEGVNAKVGYFVSPVGLRVDSKITKGVHRNVRYFGLSVFF